MTDQGDPSSADFNDSSFFNWSESGNSSAFQSAIAQCASCGNCTESTGLKLKPHALSIHDYDTLLTSLKKENFNLKIRLYEMESTMQKTQSVDSIANSDKLKKEVGELRTLLRQAGEAIDVLKREKEDTEREKKVLEEEKKMWEEKKEKWDDEKKKWEAGERKWDEEKKLWQEKQKIWEEYKNTLLNKLVTSDSLQVPQPSMRSQNRSPSPMPSAAVAGIARAPGLRGLLIPKPRTQLQSELRAETAPEHGQALLRTVVKYEPSGLAKPRSRLQSEPLPETVSERGQAFPRTVAKYELSGLPKPRSRLPSEPLPETVPEHGQVYPRKATKYMVSGLKPCSQLPSGSLPETASLQGSHVQPKSPNPIQPGSLPVPVQDPHPGASCPLPVVRTYIPKPDMLVPRKPSSHTFKAVKLTRSRSPLTTVNQNHPWKRRAQ